MIEIMALILAIPIFAFYYRCRGGFAPTGSTTFARIVFWAVPCGLILHSPISGLLAFGGLMIPHAWAQHDSKLVSIAGMSSIGFARLFLILAPLVYLNHIVAVAALAGIGSGLGYWLGWNVLAGKKIGISLNTMELVESGDSWGELITGGFMGLGMAIALALS